MDHYPVSLTLELELIRTKPKPISTCCLVSRVNWKKVNKQQYAALASSKLLHAKPVLDDTNLNKTFQDINKSLTDSTKECIPAKKRNNKKPKLKVISPAILSAIQKKKAFYYWKQNHGRSNDPSNFYLLEKKLKTSELRKHIRIELAKRRHLEKTDINARQIDNALFHRLIR